jgi:catechol 2,3-dioxygenase-like lactoylglutathione lyase family enzyme
VPRDIDHIAHAVRDLDAAADFYRRIGFTVGTRNVHPPVWGTANHIVQLTGCYIEILGLGDSLGDPSAVAPHAPRYFSFGAFARDFIAGRQGLAMLALQGRGHTDADEFRAAGIGNFELFELEREGRRPDGTPIKLAFALAFASDPRAPDVGLFTCLHRHPENFWNPAFQTHPNTAVGVAGVVLVADNPSDHHIFLSAFVGERALLATSAGITMKTPRGDIAVMTPAAFHDHFATVPPDTSRGARLAAIRFAARDIDVAQGLLRAAHIPADDRNGRLVISPDAAMGATLAFERI